MRRLSEITIPHTSLRLNLLVVCEVLLLLLASLTVLLFFSRHALKEEARQDAVETLEGTVQHIDNILMNVEQSTYVICEELQGHLDEPDRMFTYSRMLVENNPYITGCAIAFKPNYYPGRKLFMAYVHESRAAKGKLVTSETFGKRPYTEQVWYTDPMASGHALWTDPLKEEEDEGVTISFCLPIYDSQHNRVGVVVSDLKVSLLSDIILAMKPSPNSYSVLFSAKGIYIVHPDKEKLSRRLTEFTHIGEGVDPSALDAAEAMVAGETGHKPFRLNGEDWYVFFKPLQRTQVKGRPIEDLGWSAGVVYLKDDIFGDYDHLTCLVLAITLIATAVFFLLCQMLFRRKMKLSRKLAPRIMLMAVPVFVLSLGIFYYQTRYLIRREAMERSNSILETVIQRLSNYMGTVETSTDMSALLLEENFTPDSLQAISLRIVKHNPNVLSCTVSTEPGVFPQYGNYFSVYTVNEGDTIISVREKDFSYSDKVWYKEPVITGKAGWVEPFSEHVEGTIDHNEAVATYSRPLVSERGEVLGVMATDFSFSQLAKDIIATAHPYENAYFVLLGRDGRFFIHPDTTCLFRKTIFTDADPRNNADMIALGCQMTGGHQGTMHVNVEGQRCHVCYHPVPNTDWSLAMVCPDNEVLMGYHRLAYVITVIIIIGLLLLWWLCNRAEQLMELPK